MITSNKHLSTTYKYSVVPIFIWIDTSTYHLTFLYMKLNDLKAPGFAAP